jgi:hypothetical protein
MRTFLKIAFVMAIVIAMLRWLVCWLARASRSPAGQGARITDLKALRTTFGYGREARLIERQDRWF